MNLLRIAAAGITAFVLTGCSSMNVGTDFDPQASFSELRTYALMPAPRRRGADPRTAHPLLARRIADAVEQEMTKKGYRKVERNPDFRIGYHMVLDEKVDVTTVNTVYGYRRTRWIVSQPVVTEYLQGTLILDVVDPDQNGLIWRGAASDAVDQNPNPERVQKKVNEAVSKILAEFPPS